MRITCSRGPAAQGNRKLRLRREGAWTCSAGRNVRVERLGEAFLRPIRVVITVSVRACMSRQKKARDEVALWSWEPSSHTIFHVADKGSKRLRWPEACQDERDSVIRATRPKRFDGLGSGLPKLLSNLQKGEGARTDGSQLLDDSFGRRGSTYPSQPGEREREIGVGTRNAHGLVLRFRERTITRGEPAVRRLDHDIVCESCDDKGHSTTLPGSGSNALGELRPTG